MKNSKIYILLIVFISIAYFIPFLGDVHLFDWDEINFAESAREMIVSGNYTQVSINFEPFHEKPPLFIWLQVISMKIFGINEFAARFPNAIVGLLTLLFAFYTGKKYKDDDFGFTWVLVYFGSFLPFFYFKSGIIDPTFNLFIFSAIAYFYYFYRSNNIKDLLISLTLISLAVMTKGPVGLLMFAVTTSIFVIINKKFNYFKHIFLIFVLSLIPYLLWYYTAFGYSEEILQKFIYYHIKLLTTGDAGHSGPFYYHFVVVLLGAFPASFFAIPIISKFKKYDKSSFVIINLILLFSVLVIFGIVKTKILHYSSLTYLPLTFLATLYIDDIMFKLKSISKINKISVLVYGIILSLALIIFPIFMMNIDKFLYLVKDKFTKSVLLSEVYWSGFELIPGVILIFGILIWYFLVKREYELKGFYILFTSVATTTLMFMYFLAPQIEKYTQNAPIEFYKKHSNEDVIMIPLGFKSYAHYFYGNITPEKQIAVIHNPKLKDYLLENKIDKKVYFVIKANKIEKYSNYNLKLLYSKNGFSFFEK